MQFNNTKTNNYFTRYYSKHNLRNLSIGIVKGEDTFFFNYGFDKNDEKGEFSLYEIGSVTKIFIASTYAYLVNKKQIKPEDTLHDLLGDIYNISDPLRNISLFSMLTHTSGLPRLPHGFTDLISDQENPYKGFNDEIIIKYLKFCADDTSNKKYKYSNLAYGILGFILTEKFKKELFEIFTEIIFRPLEMDQTTILSHINPLKMLQGYNALNRPVPHWEMNSFQGAGFLISSTIDMVKFIKANLYTSDVSSFLSLTHTFNTKKVALGWHKYGLLSKIFGFSKFIWHNGMTGGFASYLAINTQSEIGVIILTNKAIDLDECVLGLYGYLR